MSTRSFRATHNLMAVSANSKETAINTEQTLDTSMLVALGDVINLTPRRESNANELIGKEEPDQVYDLGNVAEAAMNFEKAQPQHFAFLYGYGLGVVASAAAGSGYQHSITPKADDLDANRSLPSFTGAQRYGKTILKRRFASLFVDQITSVFAADSWVAIRAQLKGTGKVTGSITEETLSAAGNATSLTLAANAVAGSTAAERLASVHRIRVELAAGVWTEVVYSAVSSATPAVITISAPAVPADAVSYKVLYAPAETAWMTFPARLSETPLRVSQCTFKIGGAWSGSAFTAGRELAAEVRSVEHNLANNLDVEFVFGGDAAYASRAYRNGRVQTLKVDRDFRDYILQQAIDGNEYIQAYILAEGAIYDTPHKYQVELIFPKLSVMQAPISVNGKRLGEAGDLMVLEDDTYGSVIVKVKNLVATYAA